MSADAEMSEREVDVSGDGGVIKAIIRHGDGETPSAGCDVNGMV